MYRPSAFAVDDVAAIHGVLRARVFATIAAIRDGAVRFVHAPVAVDAEDGPRGGVRFHLAIRNPMAELENGARVWISTIALDAYVSPDWYRNLVTVPTWNYIAVEGEGVVQRLSAAQLRTLLVDLSAIEEEKLLPKKPWTIDKVPKERTDALMNIIAGFSLSFERLEGKFKLSQDKSPGDIEGVIAGLESRGDAASLAVARAMRETMR